MTKNEIFMIAGMTLVTFGTRYSVLAILRNVLLPEPIFRALRYVPPAVLSAIILPTILMPEGKVNFNINNAPLYAGFIAGLIAWRTKNLLLTIVLGMLVLWGWQWMIGII